MRMVQLKATRDDLSLRTGNSAKTMAINVRSRAKLRTIIFSLFGQFPLKKTIFGSSDNPTTRGAPFSTGRRKVTSRHGSRSTSSSRSSLNFVPVGNAQSAKRTKQHQQPLD